ncbi:MAG: ABC transporter permease [Planctomycetaceae bacterium]|nr:ABC transporter permease [Planctomycetaceae bacterium]
MLGGLGLLLGTLGLSAVMMRNVLERRAEIGLLKALGLTNRRVVQLVLIENCVVLFWGMLSGTTAALVAVSPHLQTTGADVPWFSLLLILGAVAVTGTLAAAMPIRMATRVSVREAMSAL